MNVAIIGCGYWGPNLIRNFYAIPECNVSACCDRDSKKLDRMRNLFPGIRVISNYRDMLNSSEIDAIAVATPVYTHHELARACLMAGKHVMVEKPLASSRAQCMDLITIAQEMNKVLMVGHTFEYTAAVNKAKELIESGEVGEVLYISSLRLNLGLFQPDINVVWDLAPHDISIILYILGKDPIWVNGQGKAHFSKDIEDVATATMHFDNGEISFLHQSWLDPCKVRKMTIVGSKKMLVYDDVVPNEKIKVFDKGVEVPPQYDTYAEFQFSYRSGDIYIPRLEEHEPLKTECEHFLECIRENKTPRSDGYSGLRVVSVLEAINDSIRNNGVAIHVKSGFENGLVDNKTKRNNSNPHIPSYE